MFKFIVSAGCSQLIREIQLYSVSGEAMSNALTREMRAGDTMRHYDTRLLTQTTIGTLAGVGGGLLCACIGQTMGQGGTKMPSSISLSRCQAMSRGYSVQRSVASTLPPVPHCSRRGQHRPAGELELLLLLDRWIVSLTIAVVLLLLVVL